MQLFTRVSVVTMPWVQQQQALYVFILAENLAQLLTLILADNLVLIPTRIVMAVETSP